MADWKCPECHLDYGTLLIPNAITTVRSMPRRFGEALAPQPDEDTDAIIRTRPSEGVWAALEYAAHVADLFPLFAETIERINLHSKPDVASLWTDDPDKLAIDRDYNSQAPTAVIARMKEGAEAVAAACEKVEPDSWSRTGEFPWGERDMAVMLKFVAHEGVHHLHDVEVGLKKVRAAS